MNARLQTIESENAVLAQRMVEQRKEIEGLLAVLEGVVGNLEKGGEELQEVGTGVSEDARKAEEVLGSI